MKPTKQTQPKIAPVNFHGITSDVQNFSISKEPQPPEIPNAVELLDKCIGVLKGEIQELEQKLAPVLGADTPVGQGEFGIIGRSPLGGRLSSLAEHVRQISGVVQSISSRLEL